MEIGSVIQVDIEREVQQSYLDYAMSVIVSRALPDVRDGLKPVQRRVLYAMYDMGLRSDKPYKKCARIVGEVLGKYHPHGDVPVYEALVRMAQDFSMRYLLADGQGNFGSNDGDSAAAMRYTEARLHQVGEAMLTDIEKETVDFGPNFDATLTEPLVLPTVVPNLLVNGATGIAVGMATNIPPHNLGEVCDALIYLIEQTDRAEDVDVEELMQFIQGPDFPTGGTLYRFMGSGSDRVDALENAYAVGRGRFTVQSKAHIEEMSRNRNRIVVTELPYQVNKARLSERIAELARDGRIEGIADLRDESDHQGMRLVVELTRTADPRAVLAQLFKHTPMQSTYGLIMLALVNGEPRVLPLKRVLQLFLDHRREVVTRRSQHDLEKARQRGHILEGLLVALDNLDEVIRLIRRSPSAEDARVGLMKKFKLTEIQAQAILDLQLRRLAALERKKIEEEYAEIKALIRKLEDLLASERKIMGVVRDELKALKVKYGDARRTRIVTEGDVSLTAGDLVHEADVVVAVSPKGQMRLLNQAQAGSLTGILDGEAAALVAWGSMRDDLCAVDARGTAAIVALHRLPFDERTGWSPAADVLGLPRESRVAGLVCLSRPVEAEGVPEGFVVAVTRAGKVKRVALGDLSGVRGTGTIIGVDAEDEVIALLRTDGSQDLLLVAASGKAIRFKEEEVRSMGLAAGGVLGIRLAAGDGLVGAGALAPEGSVVLVSRSGSAKRVPAGEFPVQSRYGQGVVAFPVSPKSGDVAAGMAIDESGTLAVLSAEGRVVPLTWDRVPALHRASSGKTVVELRAGDTVSSAILVVQRAGPPEGAGSEEAPARQLTLGDGEQPSKAKRAASRPRAKAEKPARAAKKATTGKVRATGAKTAARSAATGAAKPGRSGKPSASEGKPVAGGKAAKAPAAKAATKPARSDKAAAAKTTVAAGGGSKPSAAEAGTKPSRTGKTVLPKGKSSVVVKGATLPVAKASPKPAAKSAPGGKAAAKPVSKATPPRKAAPKGTPKPALGKSPVKPGKAVTRATPAVKPAVKPVERPKAEPKPEPGKGSPAEPSPKPGGIAGGRKGSGATAKRKVAPRSVKR